MEDESVLKPVLVRPTTLTVIALIRKTAGILLHQSELVGGLLRRGGTNVRPLEMAFDTYSLSKGPK